MSDQTRNVNTGFLEGAVNILTEDRVVFQGQIVNNNCEVRKSFFPSQNNAANQNFIFLELRCEPAIIRDNAQLQAINPPLFEPGDIIKIRITDIVAVGPGTGCPVQNDD